MCAISKVPAVWPSETPASMPADVVPPPVPERPAFSASNEGRPTVPNAAVVLPQLPGPNGLATLDGQTTRSAAPPTVSITLVLYPYATATALTSVAVNRISRTDVSPMATPVSVVVPTPAPAPLVLIHTMLMELALAVPARPSVTTRAARIPTRVRKVRIYSLLRDPVSPVPWCSRFDRTAFVLEALARRSALVDEATGAVAATHG